LVLDAIVKQLFFDKMSGLQFNHALNEANWPAWTPDATVIRGSNYLSESFDLGPVVPLLKHLKGPVVAMGVGAQAASYRSLAIPKGSIEFWRAVAGSCTSLGVRGVYSAEVFNSIGIKNLRIIGCPSFYRSMQPELHIRRADPANARVGVTLNKYLSGDYSISYGKTNRLQRALLKAVAHRPGSRLFSQGEKEETLVAYGAPEGKAALVEAILANFGLSGDLAVAELLSQRISAHLDADAWADDVGATTDFMIGFRLHGNAIGLQQGIPSVPFTYDSRTREMAALFRIPSIEVDDFMPVDLDQTIAKAEFGPFQEAYRQNYHEYRRFLEENGLPHRLPDAGGTAPSATPSATPWDVRLEHGVADLTAWMQQEVDHFAGSVETLSQRVWTMLNEKQAPPAS
jgi:hypothetical protein